MSESRGHLWSAADTDGIRECRNRGCTVRTARDGEVWQRKKGGHWKTAAPLFGTSNPIPPCVAEAMTPDRKRAP